jgi:hypothetical protein
MSTKIYNAYKVEGLSIQEVMNKILVCKEVHQDKVHEHMCDLLDPEWVKEKFKNVWGLYDKIVDDVTSQKMSVFGFNSSVVVYFHEDDIYIQEFINIRNFSITEVFCDNIRDYHYQNQCDVWHDMKLWEKTITEEQHTEHQKDWERREKVWDEILDHSGIPSNCGLSFEFYDKMDVMKSVRRYWKENIKGD